MPTTINLKTFFQKKKISFSNKTVVVGLFWFTIILCIVLVTIDGFIFYRYSYTVVNSTPSTSPTEIGLDEKGLAQAADILEKRQAALQQLLGQ